MTHIYDTNFQNSIDDNEKNVYRELIEMIKNNNLSSTSIDDIQITEIGKEWFEIRIPHRTISKFEILIDATGTDFEVFFAGTIQHFEEYSNEEEKIEDFINCITEILTSNIEIHTFYKGKKMIKSELYFTNKYGVKKHISSPLYINLELFNPFLKKREIIETISFLDL